MSTQTPNYPTHRNSQSTARVPPPKPSQSLNENIQQVQHPQQLNLQAHENNLEAMDISAQPTTPPRTPQRINHGRNANNTRMNAASESATKPRSKGKNRSKNITSPAIALSDRNTPPLTSQSAGMPPSARPISTPSAAAYAGPTFHASPAPSALPIPSFYSKSVPESPGFNALLKSGKDETASSGADSPTPPSTAPAPVPHREESPLDFIFNAHREERARSASGSGGPFDLPAQSPQQSTVTPLPNKQPANRGHRSMGSGSGLFAMELDGNGSPGKPVGPAFSTPYTERINAARTGKPSTVSPQNGDRSQALKDFLFSQSPKQPAPDVLSFPDIPPQTASGSRTTSTPLRSHQNSHPRYQERAGANTLPRTNNRTSGLRREVEITPTKTPAESVNIPNQEQLTPSRPSRGTPSSRPFTGENVSYQPDPATFPSPITRNSNSVPSNSVDLRGMEDSLRRILKLEPTSSKSSPLAPPAGGEGMGNLPAAAASVPNYVGGRAPPMNGLHNGVMGS